MKAFFLAALVGASVYPAIVSASSLKEYQYQQEPGCMETALAGVNSIGETIGMCWQGNKKHQDLKETSFVFEGGQFHLISISRALYTFPSGINDAGQAVGYFYNGQSVLGFLYNSDGSTTVISVPGSTGTIAAAINRTGEITGSVTQDNGVSCGFNFHSKNGKFISYCVPNALGTVSKAINKSGTTAGAYEDMNGMSHGLLRSDAGELTEFDAPGASGYGTVTNGINDKGDVTGCFTDSNGDFHGFLRYSTGTFQQIDVPGGTDTCSNSINRDDKITGAFTDEEGHTRAFIGYPNGRISIPHGRRFEEYSYGESVINSGLVAGTAVNVGFITR